MPQKSDDSPLISACLIVRNERDLLPDCLASISSVADEIIVVDTGSEDGTPAIAQEAGARVLHFAWNDDFAAARNHGLEAARGQWILCIDADERLATPDLLLEAVHQAKSSIGVFLLRVVSERQTAEGRTDQVVNGLPRLFRRDERIRYSGRVHENIFAAIQLAQLEIADSGITLEHLGFNLSPEQLRAKVERNLRLIDLEIADQPDNVFMRFQRGKTLLGLQRRAEALAEFEQALEQKSESSLRVQLLNNTAMLYLEDGRLSDARKLMSESLDLTPGQTFAHFVLGETAARDGDHRTALDHFKAMQLIAENTDESRRVTGDFELPAEQIHFRIGRESLALGDRESAEHAFREALRINPDEAGSRAGLAAIDTPLLTLNMIVKNEEQRLPASLNSVRGVVDEIVIYDTGSTDKTIEIAEAAGARVIRGAWKEDFAAARNEALKHARGQWILYLDADERIEPDQARLLRQLIVSAPDDVGAFICTLVSPHAQAGGGTKMHTAGYPRLFRNYGYPKIKFVHRVHEQISPSITALGKQIAPSDIRIHHAGYDDSPEVIRGKMERNYHLLIAQVRDEPQNAYAWFQLGQTLNLMGLGEQAEQSFNMSLQIGELPDHLAASVHSSLSHINGQRRNFSEALQHADKSISHAPEQIFAYNLRAYALLYLERYAEAVAAFEETLERMDRQAGRLQSAFEVELDRKLVEDGLAKAHARVQP